MKKFENWTIAYRERSAGKCLLNDQRSPFRVIPNTWRYWAADPHLVEHEGNRYVFAELYDRVLRRGAVGYCQIDGDGASSWRIALRMPYHLSYPHILKDGDEYFMIPESYVANEIAVFKAVRFPEQWEKCAVLKQDYCAVDSTVWEQNGRKWLMTLRFRGDDEELMLFPLSRGGLQGDGIRLAVNDPNKRPAGYFICVEGNLIRPAQDCTESYGCALNFYEVTDVGESGYAERLICKIRPGEINSDLGRAAEGIHTYNCDEQYEVIDLKGYEIDWLFYVMRPIWFAWRRVKKVFGK